MEGYYHLWGNVKQIVAEVTSSVVLRNRDASLMTQARPIGARLAICQHKAVQLFKPLPQAQEPNH